MSLEREIRALEGELAGLEARHKRRLANRATVGTRPQDQQRARKADRPRCGARLRGPRTGRTCMAPVLVTREPDGSIRVHKKCRLHGSASRGPSTEAGMASLRAYARARKRGPRGRWVAVNHERTTE